jgi:hypothetical protein
MDAGSAKSFQQVESFAAGGGIPRVIHVDKEKVERLRASFVQHRFGSARGDRHVASALQEETGSLEHVGLIVTYKNSHSGLEGCIRSTTA